MGKKHKKHREEAEERVKLEKEKNRELKTNAGVVALFVIFGIYLGWPAAYTLFLIVLLWAIFSSIPSYYMVYPVVGLLILIPLAISQGKRLGAEQMGIFAFYFLTVAVFLGIRELLIEPSLETAE